MPVEIARHTPEELEEFRRLPFTEVCFRRGAAVCHAGRAGKKCCGSPSPRHQFSRKAGFAFGPRCTFWNLFHGGPHWHSRDFGARFTARLMGYFVRGESRTLDRCLGGDLRRHRSAVATGFYACREFAL